MGTLTLALKEIRQKSKCLANGIMDYLVVSKICQHVVVCTSVDVARSTTQLNILERVACCTSSWDVSPPCIPIMMLRGKAREKYDIEGDTTNDALMACCCGCCSLIQTANEVKEHGH